MSAWDRAVGAVLSVVQKAPLAVLAVALVVAVLAGRATLDIGINTSTDDMISPDTRFLRVWHDIKERFPQRSDILVVVIEADTPDRAEDGAARLAAALAARPELFAHVRRPDGGAFLARNGLLFLDREELLDLFDALSDAAPLLQRLRADMSLRGLFAVVALAAETEGDERIAWLLGRMARVISARLAGTPAQLSWWEILAGEEATIGDRRALVLVQPRAIDYGSLLPGADVLDSVRVIAGDAGLTAANGIRVALTGSPALAHDELAAAQSGAARAGALSLVLVTLILLWGLRSPRQVAAALFTLVIGLVWTAGFAAVVIGHLNLISIAFAVLFVSLAIDFSIHICLRVSESVGFGLAPRAAVAEGSRAVAGSLGLCAVSTACGFYAFLATDYRGIAELGLIAGSGMMIALIANLTVLPALLTLWPGRAGPPPPPLALPRPPARRVRLVALAVLVFSLLALPWLRFDSNPLNLQDPTAESVRMARALMAEDTRDIWTAASLAADWDEAARRAAAFAALDEVDHVTWLASLVPDNQQQRLEIIEEMAAVFAPSPFARDWQPPDMAAQRAAAAALAGVLDGANSPEARALATALAGLAAAPDAAILAAEQDLLGALPGRLAALDTALTAAPFGRDDLPGELIALYRAADGALRLDIHPAEDVTDDPRALARFVTALRGVDADVSDDPVIVVEAGRVVIGAFVQALLSALALIAALLYAVTRRARDVATVLAPIALAAAATGAVMVAFGLTLNFANVIVLPLLLGIGVDSAIHLVHRHRHERHRPLLRTATARAVLFSALTTMAGFGSLMLSPHLGTASMGQLLLIGVALVTLATLFVVPALLPPAARTGRG